ncbi:MAG: hypothetical protein ACE5GM_11640, partial [bacterium]
KILLLLIALVASIGLLNQAVRFSDYMYGYLTDLPEEEPARPEKLYFINNKIPSPAKQKPKRPQVDLHER